MFENRTSADSVPTGITWYSDKTTGTKPTRLVSCSFFVLIFRNWKKRNLTEKRKSSTYQITDSFPCPMLCHSNIQNPKIRHNKCQSHNERTTKSYYAVIFKLDKQRILPDILTSGGLPWNASNRFMSI